MTPGSSIGSASAGRTVGPAYAASQGFDLPSNVSQNPLEELRAIASSILKRIASPNASAPTSPEQTCKLTNDSVEVFKLIVSLASTINEGFELREERDPAIGIEAMPIVFRHLGEVLEAHQKSTRGLPLHASSAEK